MNLKALDVNGVMVFGDANYRGDCPTETAEIIGFFSLLRAKYPQLAKVAMHIRNEGKKSARQGFHQRQEGMLKGAADIIIMTSPPLAIELKRKDMSKSKISKEQIDFLVACNKNGCNAVVALGAVAAMKAVVSCIKPSLLA